MKFRNKKTGEIKDASEVLDMKQEDGVMYKYYSLAELNKEWEDYTDEKLFYYINTVAPIAREAVSWVEDNEDPNWQNFQKDIGNYFETREEAEKTVEKLRAWQRLKNKGFRFKGYTDDSGDLFSCQVIRCSFDYSGDYAESRKDLDLLFGGEE